MGAAFAVAVVLAFSAPFSHCDYSWADVPTQDFVAGDDVPSFEANGGVPTPGPVEGEDCATDQGCRGEDESTDGASDAISSEGDLGNDEIAPIAEQATGDAATPAQRSVSGWGRVYGQHHFDTMSKVSQTGWSASENVVIATDANFWDALAANSLAGALKAPVLLTSKGSLSPQTLDEIRRLGAKTAYVCGGPIAISSHVDDQIRSAGCSVRRVYGQDQQGTSLKIAELVHSMRPVSGVIVATSRTFQDALSSAPYSYANGVPVLICNSGSNVLSGDILSFVRSVKPSFAMIAGGPIAVSSSVEGQLSSSGVSAVERVYGQTEYETSNEIAKWCLSHGMTGSAVGVATGLTFYDALTGAGLCGINNSVLVIASNDNRVCLTDFISAHRQGITGGYVFGGSIAISDSVYRTLEHCWANGYSGDYSTDDEIPYRAIYNYEFYRSKYPDVAAAFGNNRAATLNHFLNTGRRERRQGCAGFDVRSYYNQYEDLRRSYGVNWPSYYEHYRSHGQREGRAGTGCTSLNGWQFHNIAWSGQPNSYYCGPTAGFMILQTIGAGRSASGTPLSVWAVGDYMGTNRYGYTSFNDRMFERGMDSWLGWDAYTTLRTPSYESARDGVLRSYDAGRAAVVDAQERRGGPHFNGHNNGTFSHVMVIDGYNNQTDQVVFADPGARGAVWSGAQEKFTYPSLSTFIVNHCQSTVSGYRDSVGMVAPR